MIEFTKSGVRVFTCEVCKHRWLRSENSARKGDSDLPVRCAGAGHHRNWNSPPKLDTKRKIGAK